MDARTQMMLEEAGEPLEILQSLCDILNANDEEHAQSRAEFREFVSRWLRASSLKTMLRRDRDLYRELTDVCTLSLEPSSKTRMARAVVYVIKRPDGPMRYQRGASHHQAVLWFAHLVLNPLGEKLAGPCARCGRYFIKSRSDHDKYCDGGCGSKASAAVRMERKRREQRQSQLADARIAAQEWADSASSLDWKEFVAQKLGCTKKWVTIATRRYGLEEPRKGERHAAN